jgi:hypothetical protein
MPTTGLALHDREARDAARLRELDHLAHLHVRRHGDRVAQDARFVALDARHLGRLLLGREVLVDDADAALLRQGDRQACFGHGIHRCRDERQVETDIAGDGGGEVGVARQDGRVRGNQQHVVESQRFAQKAHMKQAPYAQRPCAVAS